METNDDNSASNGGAESELHAWSWSGDTKKVAALLAKGADPNWQDSIGETALFGAAGWGHSDVVKILLQNGARHDFIEKSGGWTALHWAARANLETVQALTAAEADVLAVSNSGELPIDIAHGCGKGEIVSFLKSLGPEIASRRANSIRKSNMRKK